MKNLEKVISEAIAAIDPVAVRNLPPEVVAFMSKGYTPDVKLAVLIHDGLYSLPTKVQAVLNGFYDFDTKAEIVKAIVAAIQNG